MHLFAGGCLHTKKIKKTTDQKFILKSKEGEFI